MESLITETETWKVDPKGSLPERDDIIEAKALCDVADIGGSNVFLHAIAGPAEYYNTGLLLTDQIAMFNEQVANHKRKHWCKPTVLFRNK